ncbi:MAG: hypothetical protein IJ600_00890 [Lachnospiraceae bacterium]|nr:hypothetical protein [Lachnospiraceae bacterium]
MAAGDLYEKHFGQYEKKGDYRTLARNYVALMAKTMDKSITQEEQEAFDSFSDHILGKDVNNGKIKLNPEFVLVYSLELLKYKGELNVELGMKAEDAAAKVRNGEILGTDAYRSDPKACYDLGSGLVYETYEFGLISAITTSMFEAISDFSSEPIPGELAEKYGLPQGLEFGDLMRNPGEEYTMQYLGEESILSPAEREYYRNKGGEIARLDGRYGLKIKDGAFVPDRQIKYKDSIPANWHIYSDEPVYGDEGERRDDMVRTEAEPENMVHDNMLHHLEKMERYQNGMLDMVEKAKEYLATLKKLEAGKKNQSDQFNAMADALQDVANLNETYTPWQIQEALGRLSEASRTYKEHIDSSRFRGILPNGKKRNELAGELIGFADLQFNEMDKLNDHHLDRERAITSQIDGMKAGIRKWAMESEKKAAEAAEKNSVQSAGAEKSEEKSAEKAQEKPAEKAEEKPVEKKHTGRGHEKIGLQGLQNKPDASEAPGLSEREEVLRKRAEIMNKRRENEIKMKNGTYQGPKKY